MHRELVHRGIGCSENTVAKLMRENQIRARRAPKFKVNTTNSDHRLPVFPNLLEGDFRAGQLNQVWLSDFTYIPTHDGFSYLCAFKDLCSRKIVGWAMSRRIDAELALKALSQAVALKKPSPWTDHPFGSWFPVRQPELSQKDCRIWREAEHES